VVAAEFLHVPTTQKSVVDLYRAAVKAGPVFGKFQLTLDAGWSWWRDWHGCRPDGYCAHDWADNPTTGVGAVWRDGPLRLDVALHRNWGGHIEHALLFAAGVNVW
jgi:hypothetical protein